MVLTLRRVGDVVYSFRMPPIKIDVLPLHPNMGTLWPLPTQATAGAAGLDLIAAIDEPVVILPGYRHLVPCGFAMALLAGHEAQIRPRSGLAARHSITCLNSPGTIDSDYRGQVHALLINLGRLSFTVNPGDRIAQMVIQKVPQVLLRQVDALPETSRGGGGFGSTGR